MTKKILAAFLAVMMIVSMLPTAFAAEAELKCPGVDVKHNKDNCDYVRVEEEPIVEPDCCTPGYTLYACQKCEAYFASDIKEPLGGCQKELIAEEVPATCGKEGTTAIYKCGKNGTQYGGDPIKALEHDWVHANGDCTVAHTKTCNNCGKTEEVAAASGHSWETGFTNLSIAIKTEPTLTTDGVFVYVCQNGECKAESPKYTIHAHEHTYVANAGTPNSCTAAGVKAHFTCSYEGCEMLFELVDGEYKATTAAGLVLEKKEHSYVDADDTSYVYDEWNTFIENTCQTSGYTLRKCTECEKWYEEAHTEADPNKHTWEVIEPAVVGSCTVEGKTAVEYCKVCRIVRGGETIEGTGEGHHEVTVRVEATCTKMGYTYQYCDNEFCTLKEKDYKVQGELVADGLKLIPDTAEKFPVDPDAHTLGWVITEEATCVAPGHKIWACTECKGEGTATGAYAAIEIGDAENGGHKWVLDSKADCNNAEKWHCALCNSKNYADAKPALGHTSKNPDGTQAPVLTKNPTCNKNGTGNAGYTFQQCVRCQTEINKQTIEYNATYIYDNENDARNQHTLEDVEPKEYKKGNCTDKGLWTLGKCSECNRTVLLTMEGTGEGHKQPATGVTAPTCTTTGSYTCENEWCENENNLVIIPALGHTLSFVEGKNPTCDTNGVKAHWECATCKKNFVDSDWVISDDKTTISGVPAAAMNGTFVGAQQPNLTTEIVASASGVAINWKVKEETVDGTYTFVTAAAEYTVIIKDGLFEAALVKTNDSQVINKLGHANFTLTDSVDCEQYGYRLVFCFRCRQSDMYDYVPELGHDMTEESVFTSCTTDKKFVCLRDGCDHSVVDEGTAPGHENSDGDFFWEGCLDKEDNRHCVVCCVTDDCDGKCAEGLISNAHDLYVEINDAPATCTQPGYDLVVCEVCDHEEIIINEDPLDHAWVLDGECEDKSFNATTSEPGNDHYCCSRCDACKDEPVDVINGVQFAIKADNAVVSGANTDEEGNFNPVDGDVISYEITMSALQMNVWGFNFDVFYNAASMNFLGYTYNAGDVFANYNVDNITEDELIYEFDVEGRDVNGNSINDLYGTVEDVFGTIKVSAYTENDIEGKIQDALVNGTQSVITLYFQVETKYEYTFMGVPGYGYSDLVFVDMENDDRGNYSWPTVVNSKGEVECGADYNYAFASTMMDINGSDDVTITDLYFCNQILTGEAEYEYLASADANKDGQITITDLDLMNQLLQGADESVVYEALEWTAPEGFVAA